MGIMVRVSKENTRLSDLIMGRARTSTASTTVTLHRTYIWFGLQNSYHPSDLAGLLAASDVRFKSPTDPNYD
jgi:hypothetical protein